MTYKKYELSGQAGTEIARWFFLGQPIIIVTSIVAGVAEALSPLVILPWIVLWFVIRINAYALRSISRTSKSRSNSRMTKLIWVSSFYSFFFFFYGIALGLVYYYGEEVRSSAWLDLLLPDNIWFVLSVYIETGYEIFSFSVTGALLGLVLLGECALLIWGYLKYAKDQVSEFRVFCESCKAWAIQIDSRMVSHRDFSPDSMESVEAIINEAGSTEPTSPCIGVLTLGCPICNRILAMQLENLTVTNDKEGTPVLGRELIGVYVSEIESAAPTTQNQKGINKNYS